MSDASTTESAGDAVLTALRLRFDEIVRERDALLKERDEYKALSDFLKKELDRLADAQKTPREYVDLNHVQLAFGEFEKQLLEAAAKTTEALPNQDGCAESPAPSTGESTGAANGDGGDENKKNSRKHTPHGRSVLPESLPIKTIVITPKNLPDDSVVIGEEISWRLGVLPTRFQRIKIVRPLFVVPKDKVPQDDAISVVSHDGDVSVLATAKAPAAETADGDPPLETQCKERSAMLAGELAAISESGSLSSTTIVCAVMPHEMIPRGLPTPDLLALVLTGKFADKLPFNRQQGIYSRVGVSITRGTMCGWARECHQSARYVVDAMCEEAKAKAHFIATDATGVLVQANDKCRNGHFWVFVADRDHVFFRYSARHSSDEPKLFFKGFAGTVIADAANVYDALFVPSDDVSDEEPRPEHRGGCNAHARRYFYKALQSDRERALIGIGFLNRLFELERSFAELSPSERLAKRKLESAPVVETLRFWRDRELALPDVASKTPIRRAFQYLKNHWEELTRFLHDGAIPIHNNRSELELRRLVVGRANWLFVGSDESAEWTTTFVSLVASCELHKIDPQAYLRDLFRILPAWPRHRAIELAPKYWRATRARLDPDELALPIGPVTVPPPLPAPGNELAAYHA